MPHWRGKDYAFDLYQDMHKQQTFRDWLSNKTSAVICGYNVDAEIRSLFSLYRTIYIPWNHFLCLRREQLCLANRHAGPNTGVVIEKGKKVEIPFHKFPGQKTGAHCNLLNALWSFCKIYEEKHVALKNEIVELIVTRPEEIRGRMREILEYARLDTAHLPQLLVAMWEEYHKRLQDHPELLKTLKREMLFRGEFARIIAMKGQIGHHVDVPALSSMVSKSKDILNKIAKYILEQWPERKTFSFVPRTQTYTFHALVVSEFIDKEAHPAIRQYFRKTEKKDQWSINKDVFERLYPNKHSLQKDDYLQQIYRYTATKSALSSLKLTPAPFKSARRTFGNFWEQGTCTVRPYLNDYGSQTARNQPAANGFLMLKPAWMRKYISPPPGQLMLYADWGKQEILILAVPLPRSSATTRLRLWGPLCGLWP